MDEGFEITANSEEIERVRERYQRRMVLPEADLYNPLRPSVFMGKQEKERALIKLINETGLMPVREKKVLEVGCGSGSNLLKLIELGFSPENLVANELLETHLQYAQKRLPQAVKMLFGDASEIDLEPETFDIVLQSTVFTSLLDDGFQQKLADKIWQLTKPGGGVIWYDFIHNNPSNKDVRGVQIRRIKELFPRGRIKTWKITLAPPISRRVTRLHPVLYSIFNIFPFLRTHVLCWIEKPNELSENR